MVTGAYSCGVPIHVGCLFCMGAYKRDVIAIIKMGAFINGPYFLWVPIIPINFVVCSFPLQLIMVD